MTFGKPDRDRDLLASVELLLRDVAEDTRDPAPEGLVTHALQQWATRQSRRRQATLAAAMSAFFYLARPVTNR